MTDPDAVELEIQCAQRGALLRELDAAALRVTGSDRVSWLGGLVTQEIQKRTAPAAVYGLLVQKNGKLASETFILLERDAVWLSLRGGAQEALLENLDRHLVMEDCELTLETDARFVLAFGPSAADLAERALGAGAKAGVASRGGVPAAVILVDQTRLAALRDDLLRVERVAAASEAGWRRFRVEHGIGEWGVDFGEENYPQEGALERDGVSFEKGCYLGQEAVFMLEKRGHVKKRLVQLRIDDPEGVAVGAAIVDADGNETGLVTSLAGRGRDELALGYVKYKHAKANAELTIAGRPAFVTPLLAL